VSPLDPDQARELADRKATMRRARAQGRRWYLRAVVMALVMVFALYRGGALNNLIGVVMLLLAALSASLGLSLRRSATETVTIAELLATAKESKTVALVDIFRKLGSVAKEEARPTYGGSFRYWFKDKMVFGINVAGERCSPPNGQLDVWIPVITVSNVVGMSEGTIRQKLKQNFAATESGKTDCIVRVSSPEAANSLVSLVQQWIATPTVGIAAETTASTGP